MKINEIDNLSNTIPIAHNKVNSKGGFKQILDHKLSEINPPIFQGTAEASSLIIKQSNKVLNLLDEYCRQLNDPTKTLKDLQPLVASIEQEANLFPTEAMDKTRANAELHCLVKDLTLTANVAVFKFYRGD